MNKCKLTTYKDKERDRRTCRQQKRTMEQSNNEEVNHPTTTKQKLQLVIGLEPLDSVATAFCPRRFYKYNVEEK